jgi:hypothetical protein
MTLPPVFHRELKRRASRPKTWWIRFALVAAAALAWFIALTSGAIIGATGKTLLIAISAIPLLIAALCGVVTTADCLARDKRDRTLELLLFTELHPLEIILHKLLATTAPVFSGLLAIAPLSLIAVIIGGVSGPEALAVGLLTLATALLSASIGMLISSFARSIFTAMLATFCTCALFFGSSLIPAIQSGASTLTALLNLANPFALLHPIFFDPLANITAADVINTALLSTSAAICLLLLSALVLPRAIKIPTTLAALSGRTLLEHTLTLACTLLAPLLVLLSFFVQSAPPMLALAIFAGMLAKLVVLASVVRILNTRPWLELILTTPLPPRTYILQELLRFSPRIIFILAICLTAEIILLIRLPGGYRPFALAITLFLLLDALALVLVGLWNGLKHRSLSEAISFSLTSVLLIPIAIAGLLLALGFRTQTIAGGVLLYALLSLATDTLAAASAQWMLHHRLRHAASS